MTGGLRLWKNSRNKLKVNNLQTKRQQETLAAFWFILEWSIPGQLL